ncbi:hypothetical protein LVB87_01525 [Lysobacter sp. KIS68-7]|uniref:hypothetical protein n=1 Tax=Lysobacter sp. KIS68-7 TaxID=2904252 RepID=UPI001E3D3E3C|nr:hypothetical protein [Lysobacter sp. KIS68-7]UHQ19874.1 hypothetical protein LVB87_01525 [Lysobacter sp. KIS68-7]
MKDPVAWRLIRWLYAAFYIVTGMQMALVLLGLLPPPQLKLSPEDSAFQAALAQTGFIVPALAATYVVAGIAMLFHRTAPLGIVLLAPVMLIIFLTNTLLDTAWIWGTLHMAVLLALAWHFRRAFRPLWTFGTATQ